MRKSEIMETLVSKVCEVCEISSESFFGSTKMQMVVDARILASQYLRRIGFSNDEISLMFERHRKKDLSYIPSTVELKKKAKNVQRLFDSYSQRCMESYAFCIMSNDIKQFCREKYSELHNPWMKCLPSK